jgi:hypothetical protein
LRLLGYPTHNSGQAGLEKKERAETKTTQKKRERERETQQGNIMSPQFPIVKGVEVLLEAPEGYEVDFDNPQLDHTNIRATIGLFVVEYALCLLFFGQRIYTNAILLRNFRIDDCMFQPPF